MKKNEGFQTLAIANIRPSPMNPRRNGVAIEDEPGFGEFVASVRAQGILQPITVRPDAMDADLYEIVCGERRFLAAKACEMKEIAALVRADLVTNASVLEAMMVENDQRLDLHPMQRARTYRRYLDLPDVAGEVAQLAQKVGRSVSEVYQTLKLLEMIPVGVQLFELGLMTVGHAVQVARLPIDAQQGALEAMAPVEDYNPMTLKAMIATKTPVAVSVRQFAAWIAREVVRDLNKAPFDKNNADLVPAAGACPMCPKRTGHQPELFADLDGKKGRDRCLDGVCFQGKAIAALLAGLSPVEREGLIVITSGGALRGALAFPVDQVSAQLARKVEVLSHWAVTVAQSGKWKPCDSQVKAIRLDQLPVALESACHDSECKVHGQKAVAGEKTAPTKGEKIAKEQVRQIQDWRSRALRALSGESAFCGKLGALAEDFLREAIWAAWERCLHDGKKAFFKALGLEPKKGGYGLDFDPKFKAWAEVAKPGSLPGILAQILASVNLTGGGSAEFEPSKSADPDLPSREALGKEFFGWFKALEVVPPRFTWNKERLQAISEGRRAPKEKTVVDEQSSPKKANASRAASKKAPKSAVSVRTVKAGGSPRAKKASKGTPKKKKAV